MTSSDYNYCLGAGASLYAVSQTLQCFEAEYGFTHYNSPLSGGSTIVEHVNAVIFTHNRTRVSEMFDPITSFLEPEEKPQTAILRETEEEFGLSSETAKLIGAYDHPALNQVTVADQFFADEEIRLGHDLDILKLIPVSKLKSSSFWTALAVHDRLTQRNSLYVP